LVKSDIQQVLGLFSVMQNIHMHGIIGDNFPLEWVSVEQIYREMPPPKMTKDKLRDFCEYQTEQGNLERRTGKDKEIRQAKAEYRVSQQGKRTIAVFFDPTFANVKNMITWRHKTSKEKSLDKKEDQTEDET